MTTFCSTCEVPSQNLKRDLLGQWIESEWKPRFPQQPLLTLLTQSACVHHEALARLKDRVVAGYTFLGYTPLESPLPRIHDYNYTGELTYQSGTFLYRFAHAETAEVVEVLVAATYCDDAGYIDWACLACMPESFRLVWVAFADKCEKRVYSRKPSKKVVVLGGRSSSFKPTVEWDEVILPVELKSELQQDVRSFFSKGVDVYKRLKLKPFRKLLLAGVPGTGKTMLCNALAKWALEQKYLVIYISSGDREEISFGKVYRALKIAASSKVPTLILMEEIDVYLQKEEQRALVLNVLDGSESAVNDHGTLLIATTNRPEAIDERVLKRPGRLDRIFIIPETRSHDDAQRMLMQYLGDMWQADHTEVAERLVGYPGAFIREVAIYALTQVAYQDLTELSPELLHESFERLREQIDARDDFLMKKGNLGLLNGILT